jgi:hypothetical protein
MYVFKECLVLKHVEGNLGIEFLHNYVDSTFKFCCDGTSADVLDQPLEVICVCLVRSKFCIRIKEYVFNSLSAFDGHVCRLPSKESRQQQ